jgi:hypothetical protein
MNDKVTSADSENNTDSEKNTKVYEDYDNRPIKPLDPNLLNQQLSEYSEISNDELEQMRNKYLIFFSSSYIIVLLKFALFALIYVK